MNKHSIDAVSLAFGLVFVVAVGWWALVHLVDVTLPGIGWFLAGALILFGLLGLVATARSQLGHPRPGR